MYPSYHLLPFVPTLRTLSTSTAFYFAQYSKESEPKKERSITYRYSKNMNNDSVWQDEAELYEDELYGDEGQGDEGYDEYNIENGEVDGGDGGGGGGGVRFDQSYTQQPSNARRRSRLKKPALSKVSKAYDTGGKGFLTPAEQELREMDVEGEGRLSNAAVARIMESKLHGEAIIRRLSRMLWILAAMTVLLILANLGTAWAVAVMAKESTIDLGSGEMWVKDDGAVRMVTTRGAGDTFIFANFNLSALSAFVDEDEDDNAGTGNNGTENENKTLSVQDDSLFCITADNAAKIWHDASQGTPVTAMLDYTSPVDYEGAETEDDIPLDVRSLSLNSDGALINETHACLGTGHRSVGLAFLCIEFLSSSCDQGDNTQEGQESLESASTTANSFFAPNTANEGDGEGPSQRRRLFQDALNKLQAASPNVGHSHANLLRGNPHDPVATNSADNLRRTRRCGRKRKCRRRRRQRDREFSLTGTAPNAHNSISVSVAAACSSFRAGGFGSGCTPSTNDGRLGSTGSGSGSTFTNQAFGGGSSGPTGQNERDGDQVAPTSITSSQFVSTAFGRGGGASQQSARNPIPSAPSSSFTVGFLSF